MSISERRYKQLQMRVKRMQKLFLWHVKPEKYDMFHMILHSKSAERASFAARAAAELSSKEKMRMTMQSFTESPNSSSYDNIRNEPSHRHSRSNVQSGGFVKEEMSRSNNSLETRQSNSFAKIGRAKQQPIKDDVNDSCQLKKQSSLASSSSHTSYVSDDNNVIFEDKRFQSTVEDTKRKSHGHDVAPVMVTADKSILSVFVLCCLSISVNILKIKSKSINMKDILLLVLVD
ncbi:unnamed protein product [Brassica oleracea var. botrytis]|uniref:(rape) hypothetical protein n=1 Tax=Brassica napus TaxID=3708 RepID=A0A816QI32_BRANA|nr:unnamed protein product [Brassica napus]